MNEIFVALFLFLGFIFCFFISKVKTIQINITLSKNN